MELVINEASYYIPNKWNEVSLGCYMDFVEAYSEEGTDLENDIALLSSFIGAPIDMLGGIKKSILDEAVERLSALMESKVTEDLNLIVEIDGVEYGLHPNLQDLKLKEFVDLDNKLEEGWANMHAVMAILYRPVVSQKKGKYKIEDYDYKTAKKRAELFKDNMSVETVNAAAAFFLRIGIDYTTITQVYSKMDRRTRRKATRAKKKSLTRNTDGTV